MKKKILKHGLVNKNHSQMASTAGHTNSSYYNSSENRSRLEYNGTNSSVYSNNHDKNNSIRNIKKNTPHNINNNKNHINGVGTSLGTRKRQTIGNNSNNNYNNNYINNNDPNYLNKNNQMTSSTNTHNTNNNSGSYNLQNNNNTNGGPNSQYNGNNQDLNNNYLKSTESENYSVGGLYNPIEELQLEESNELYCFCQKPSWGDMIECDNDGKCKYKWFHFECVNLTEEPVGAWFCSDCKEKEKMKRKRR